MTLEEVDINKILNDIISGRETFTASDVYSKSLNNHKRIRETFGDKYESYLDLARPRQSVGQKNYRKEFFEKEGNPVSVFIDRVCNKFSVIFQNKDYKVSYEDEKSLLAFNSTGFEKWFTSNIFRMLTMHPNGCIYLTNEADGITEQVSYGFAEPDSVLVHSSHLCIIKNFDDYYFYG